MKYPCWERWISTQKHLSDMPKISWISLINFTQDHNIKSSIEHASFSADKKKMPDNVNFYKSPGADEFHPRILKNCLINYPCPSLSFSFFFFEVIPWKITTSKLITPLPKKWEKEFGSNYRPISLISVVCKIMESITKDNILAFMISNTLVPGKSSVGRKLNFCRLIYLRRFCKNTWFSVRQ